MLLHTPVEQTAQDRVLSLNEVSAIIGRSPKTLWKWHAKDKTFPEPIKMNGRCIGWRESIVNDFLNQACK